jgi:hypothetical protein
MYFNVVFLMFLLHRMAKLAMVVMYNIEHDLTTNLEAKSMLADRS